ncbi:hypothetical protein ACH4ZU_24110 [Streptomyces sp. NPDC020472]|uniref:hypothetical protein n=1 Tax=Streptomyces sp. NPDC020472 TaxID=3365075 RepID=UPI003790C567
MSEGLTLASTWDAVDDVVRFLWLVTSRHLPEWVRHPLIAIGLTLLVHEGLQWLRTRFGESDEGNRPVQEIDSSVR